MQSISLPVRKPNVDRCNVHGKTPSGGSRLPRVGALVITAQVMLAAVVAKPMAAQDWTGFRGPGGLGVSRQSGVPWQWSSKKNIVWKTPLPGPGASSPISFGNRVFVTCYSGYGLQPGQGDQKNLKRHLLCLDRATGKIVWQKTFEPELPEHQYKGEGSYHGYAASTPTTDGQRLYVFFGKSGVFCFDLNGKKIWHADVGRKTNRWGSGCSPVLYKDLLIINASVESGALLALNKITGKEVWRTKGMAQSWNTPLIVPSSKRAELVVSVANHLVSFEPQAGRELWRAEGVHRYVCPSVVHNGDTVFAIGGGHTSLAVRTGGNGNVDKSHGIWRLKKGANVSSPVYYQGHLYWTRDGGTFCCQDPKTGKLLYEKRPKPSAGRIWSSPILTGGKLYYVSQHNGTFVVAAKPEFELLAHNVFEDDKSRTNASPAVSRGQLLFRTDKNLYCLGSK